MGKLLYIRSENDIDDEFEFSINFWNVVFSDCYGYVKTSLSSNEIENISWELKDAGGTDQYGDSADDFVPILKSPEALKHAITKLYEIFTESPGKYMVYGGEGVANVPVCEIYKRDFEAILKYCSKANDQNCCVVLFGYY